MSVILSVLVVLSLLAAPSVAAARPDQDARPEPASGTGQVITAKSAYGPNEAIRAMGAISYIQGCKTHPEHAGKGVDDIFQPWADLYIVPRGSTPLGGSLTDVSGAPNVIFGGLAGGFVEEVIGYTGPSGDIGAGVYDIVIDECQDGILDLEDALIVEAFRVVIPLGTEPAAIGAPDKARAASLSTQYKNLGKAWEMLLKAINKRKIGPVKVGMASDFSMGLFQILTQTVLPDPRPAVGATLIQMGRRQAGLAADPPDPNFQGHATFDAGQAIGPGLTGEPLEDLVLAAAREQAVDSALIAALVRAVERHQGAAEVGDGDWMAAHARDALAILDAIESRSATSPDAVRAVAAGYHAEIFQIRDHLGELMQRARPYLYEGDPHKDLRDALNSGIAEEDADAVMRQLAELEEATLIIGGLGNLDFPNNLRALADQAEAQALGFGDLRTDLEAALASLASEGRDAPRPVAEAGGPYTAVVGEPVQLDGTASTGSSAGSSVVAWEWDLDLDGAYDDSTDAQPTFVGDQPGSRLVALRVTDDEGSSDITLASVEVTVGDLSPVITSVTPLPSEHAGDPASEFTFTVEAEDPEGEPVTVEWVSGGAVVGEGTSFSGTAPTPWGTDRYDAFVRDPAGNLAVQTFFATGLGPDADGDGWRVPGDCDDTNANVRRDSYPGEIVDNGLDDDCNPETSDQAEAPRVHSISVNSNRMVISGHQEGDLVVTNTNWSHPLRYSGQEFTWSVDWGDGTVTTGAVAGTNHTQTDITPEHVFRSAGRKSVKLCITAPGDLTNCVTNGDLFYRTPVLPAPPVVHPANLEEWTSYDIGRPDDPVAGGTSNWHIAPGGFSGLQTTNRNLANVLLSPFEMDYSRTGSARFAIDLGTIGADDDTIGFTIGLDEGEAELDDADWLMVRMWGHLETVNAGSCGGSGSSVRYDPDPVGLLRIKGYPEWSEWAGAIHDIPDATNPLCRDDMGAVTLDGRRLPEPLGTPVAGTWRRLVHPAYMTAPQWQIDHLYHAEVEISPEEVTVWLDGVQILHAEATPDHPFPMGRIGLLSASQPSTRLIGHTQVPIEDAVQGVERGFSATFADADLVASHTAVIDWGDGSPATQASIEEIPGRPGFWTVSADHAYMALGVHDAEVCVTDTEDLQIGCGMITVVVENSPPVVEAGPDVSTVGPVTLTSTTYSDPGAFDVHTATIDWGDGSGPEAATIGGRPGSGVVHGSHTFTVPGTHTVEVCVTDSARQGTRPMPGDEVGLVGCDSFEVEVLAPVTPQALIAEEVTGPEGGAIEVAVGFGDGANGQVHEIHVDWGDGNPAERVGIFDAGRAGIGWPTHTWAQDGTYEVTATVCVVGDDERCDTTTSQVVVTNAAPVLDEPLALSVVEGEHRLVATYSDPGTLDTHTATVDWGDGAGPVPATVQPDGAGGGTVTASHRYPASGQRAVEVCVADDGGAEACAVADTQVSAVPGPPLAVSAVGGDALARVRWDPPASDGGSPITGYEVETTPGLAVSAAGATPTSLEVTGLVSGVDHTFRVRASNVNGWGPWSEPSNVARPRASCAGGAFPDVGPTHPFCPEITWMADEGVSGGYADGNYKPAVPTTRQAMAAFLYRLAGSPDGLDPTCTAAPFRDVLSSHPFCGEIAWMAREGISTGYADGTYKPAQPISRQAMAAFLQRVTTGGEPPAPCTSDRFTDVAAGHQFCGAIAWMVGAGVAEGYADGSFGTTAQVSRQAMAAFVYRYAIYIND